MKKQITNGHILYLKRGLGLVQSERKNWRQTDLKDLNNLKWSIYFVNAKVTLDFFTNIQGFLSFEIKGKFRSNEI